LFEALGEEGVESGNLRRVHAPIGLDIGAVTPEEIAVAIVAELIAVRYGRIDAGAEAPAQSVRTSKWTPADVTASARH
ncbi:MAG: XdhC family protein, partial [Vicinamibacterales bacterium]